MVREPKKRNTTARKMRCVNEVCGHGSLLECIGNLREVIKMLTEEVKENIGKASAFQSLLEAINSNEKLAPVVHSFISSSIDSQNTKIKAMTDSEYTKIVMQMAMHNGTDAMMAAPVMISMYKDAAGQHKRALSFIAKVTYEQGEGTQDA